MKKLLNIDGGGIKVYFSLLILKYIENKTNKSIKDLFDFFAGVSASSIILSGILTDNNINSIINKLKLVGNNIFYKSYFYSIISLGGLIKSKYPEIHINDEFQLLFSDIKLKDIKKPYIILCYDLISQSPIYYSSYDKSLNNELLWKIIRSSTAAPILFPPFKLNDKLLVDGSILTNDLSELTYTHALKYYSNINEEFIQISIGTGKYCSNITTIPTGLCSWNKNLLEILFNAHSKYEYNTMKEISQINNLKYYRINIELNNYIHIDDYTAFDEMDIIFNNWISKQENIDYLDYICDILIKKI
jgi:patatin-like phospholipase/acyl hydrolase